ncbi:NUDIX domain-containing protein [Marinilabiliaceae bacterium JC017]|nr:NUDIX domain-containing protein [Marinilabiliaceae bacterium JC017]
MLQMYKVFFKDRTLFLTDQIEQDLRPPVHAIHKYTSINQLKEFIYNFEKKTHLQQGYIYSHNLEELFNAFKTCFKLIDAAGGLVFNSKNEFLCIYRRGVYDLPKGKAEPGETIEETAIREVMEECGLDKVNLKDKLLCTYHTYWLKEELVLKTTHWYQMQYEGNSPLIPQAQESITEAKWCSKDFISSFVQNTYPSIVEVLKKQGLF